MRGDESGTIRSRGTVTIEVDRCKGCELCIPACPPHVLTMSEATQPHRIPLPRAASPAAPAARACLLVCPDFVFEVFRFDTPVEHRVEATA